MVPKKCVALICCSSVIVGMDRPADSLHGKILPEFFEEYINPYDGATLGMTR